MTGGRATPRPVAAARRLNRLLAHDTGLDRPMALVASIAPDRLGRHLGVTEEAIVERFDHLAAGFTRSEAGSVAAVLDHVFGHLGFFGDAARYYDPANSQINLVLERRVGIPITLAAVVTEIARRVGVELRPVGMPGHVLLTDGSDRWYDPFRGGSELGLDDCRRLYGRFQPLNTFRPEMLAPMSTEDFVLRNLNNLRVAYSRLGDLSAVLPLLAFRSELDVAGPEVRQELAELLAQLGRHDQAADEFDRLARLSADDDTRARVFRSLARRQRAHRN